MTGERIPTSFSSGLGLVERALNYTLGSLQMVTPEAMDNPTPCQEWTLRDLLEHMNDSLFALQEAADLGDISLDLPVHPGELDLVSTLHSRGCALLSGWSSAFRRDQVTVAGHALSTDMVISIGAIEIAVHGWDVAQACGLHRPIPPALAEELLELSPMFVADDDRPARFAVAVNIPPLAGPEDRLVAYLGRQPHQSARQQSTARP